MAVAAAVTIVGWPATIHGLVVILLIVSVARGSELWFSLTPAGTLLTHA